MTNIVTDKKKIIVVAAIIAGVAVVAVFLGGFFAKPVADGIPNVSVVTESNERSPLVPLDQIVSGGPPRDGIPSIDNPKFTTAPEADKFLQGSDLVIGLDINGDVRAYPLQILVWHEIVNDKVGGTPVAVTYCPLCFTNQVFERVVDGQVVEFGTSGKLYNSNLVMYDRTSESYWSQALGQAIVGDYSGEKLQRVPFDLAYWEEWKQLYPNSKVLSRDTGFGRPYGADPYGGYYTSPDVLFPISNKDDRLGVKEIVVGLENDGIYKAYKLDDIETDKVINDEIGGKPIVLFSLNPFMVRAFDSKINGQVLEFEYEPANRIFIDKQTNSQWNFDGVSTEGPMKGNELIRLPFDEGFWFEWTAFHPETELYEKA